MRVGNIKTYYDDDNDKLFRSPVMDLYSIELNGLTRPPGTLKEELIKAAEFYYNNVPDLHIALSGGWDSNVCLSTFVEAGYKPKVVIFKFQSDWNDFDVEPAIQSCKKYGIEPKIINTANFAKFYERGLIPINDKYQTYNFVNSLFAYQFQILKENCLLVDKIFLRRDLNPKCQWSLIHPESFAWTERFNQLNDHKIYSNFFCYSPESMSAYLNLETVKTVINNRYSGKIGMQSLNHKIYKEGGFTNIPFFSRTVTSEKIVVLNSLADDKIRKHTGVVARSGYIEYNELVNSLKNQERQRWQFIL